MKSDTGEYHENYQRISIFIQIEQLQQSFYMKTYMHFCAYLKCNLLNIHQREKYFEQKLWRKTKHVLHSI
jgi:hypothetical protein